MIEIGTERLYIRDHKQEDLEEYHRLISDREVMFFLPDLLSDSLHASRRSLEDAIHESTRPWGRGIMSEAVNGVINYAFTEGKVVKIETGCLVDNRGSERVMIRAGFAREAYKKNHQFLGGTWRDRVEYGLSGKGKGSRGSGQL